MNFFLLLLTIQLFINLFFISRSESSLQQDKLLKLYVLIAGLSVFSKFIIHINESHPNLILTLSSTFAFVALSHLYIRCVVTKKVISPKTIGLHMIPFLFSMLFFLTEIVIMLFIPHIQNHKAVENLSQFALYFRLILLAVYFIADLYYIHKVSDKSAYFSFKTDKVLVSIFMLNKFVLILVITGSVLYDFNFLSFFGLSQNVVISSVIMYYKVFVPYQDKIAEQQRLLKELIFTKETKEAKTKYSKVEHDDEKLKSFVHIIETYLDNEKPYLDMDFTFDQLSEGTGIHKHDLSYALNQHLNINFYQLINHKRIGYFLEHIHEIETEGKSILSLAFESGFNSKSTFNKYFKLHTHVSPSEYIKNKENEAVKIS